MTAGGPGRALRCPEGLTVRSWGEDFDVVFVEATGNTSLVTARAGRYLAALAAGLMPEDLPEPVRLETDEIATLIASGLLVRLT